MEVLVTNKSWLTNNFFSGKKNLWFRGLINIKTKGPGSTKMLSWILLIYLYYLNYWSLHILVDLITIWTK